MKNTGVKCKKGKNENFPSYPSDEMQVDNRNCDHNVYICPSCDNDIILIPTLLTPNVINCSNCPAVCKVKFLELRSSLKERKEPSLDPEIMNRNSLLKELSIQSIKISTALKRKACEMTNCNNDVNDYLDKDIKVYTTNKLKKRKSRFTNVKASHAKSAIRDIYATEEGRTKQKDRMKKIYATEEGRTKRKDRMSNIYTTEKGRTKQ